MTKDDQEVTDTNRGLSKEYISLTMKLRAVSLK